MKLTAFDPALSKNFEISANLFFNPVNTNLIDVEFQLPAYPDMFLPESNFEINTAQIARKHELWKDTCFEFFLNPHEEKKYFEVNLSLKKAWNCYQFQSYRDPQPPTVCTDFEIQRLGWSADQKKVSAQILNCTPYQKWNVGLSAVIVNKKNQTSYFALKHAGEKPDFHLASSFTLQRGS